MRPRTSQLELLAGVSLLEGRPESESQPSSKIWFYQSLAREDTNHTLSKKSKKLQKMKIQKLLRSSCVWSGAPEESNCSLTP